jgi:hypothetical protein
MTGLRKLILILSLSKLRQYTHLHVIDEEGGNGKRSGLGEGIECVYK